MGFKIIGRKNGKKTVSDNPDNDATKVTNALKFLVEPEPSAAIKGSTIRFMWDPKTGNSCCSDFSTSRTNYKHSVNPISLLTIFFVSQIKPSSQKVQVILNCSFKVP